MQELGHLEAESAEKLQVKRQTRQPFFAAHDVRCAHKMVIDYVRKVIYGYAVALQKHVVFIVFGDLYIASYKVGEFYLVLNVAVRSETQNIRLAGFDFFFYHRNIGISVFCPFAVIAGIGAERLLFGAYGTKLLFGAEAGISHSVLNEIFCIGVIYLASFRLAVGTVISALADTLVKADVVFVENTYKIFFCALDLSFHIRIFYAQTEDAAALVGKALTDAGGKKSAEMNESRGARRKSRDFRALGQIAGRIAFFHILGRRFDVGKEQFCQISVIHSNHPFQYCI